MKELCSYGLCRGVIASRGVLVNNLKGVYWIRILKDIFFIKKKKLVDFKDYARF